MDLPFAGLRASRMHHDSPPETFVPFMHDVASCDTSLRELNLMWRLIEASVKMNYADVASLILPTMASTREHFKQLEEELVASLVREKVTNVLREIGTKAQYVIDIVVRNLYERTADVGFLATDPELCGFMAGLHHSPLEIAERLRAYRSKYTVYDEIFLLDTRGAVLAQIGDDHAPIAHTADPLLAAALATDRYVEVFRACDLRPAKRRALVYAKRMQHPVTGAVVGVLCLCFNFEQEMEGIFRSHREAGARYNMLLLDGDDRCMASADADWIPVDARVPVNPEGTPAIFMHAGRQYLVRTFAAQGYQGYAGPPGWQGQVMIPLDVAFQRAAEARHAQLEPALRQALLTQAARFSQPLHQILAAAQTIRRVVWNGQVMTAGRGGSNRLQPVLEQISETGARSNDLFASSIDHLYATVLSTSIQDAEFVSHLLVDLLDRNLYERADDCRWWALNPALRAALGNGSPDAAQRAAMSDVLDYINRLYTVYTRIVVYDLQGDILAQSRRDAGLPVASARVDGETLERVVSLESEQGYVVTPFNASPLYEGQPTYEYHAAIRSPDQPTRIVGGIGLVFDSAREFHAMLSEGLAGKADSDAFFVDRAGRVLSSTDSRHPVGSVLTLDPGLLRVARGASSSALVVHDGEYAIVGCSASAGYREFKVSDGYRDDVVAVVCGRFGEVVPDVRSRSKPVDLARSAGAQNGDKFATFYAGGELFALETAHVREARPATEVRRVRIGSPERSVGLLHLPERNGPGKTVWVFDLGALVSGRPSPVGIDSQVVVVQHEGQVVGLLSEQLHAVSSFSPAQLSASPLSSANRLVRAIIRADGGAGLVQLLDIAWLFRLFREPWLADADRAGQSREEEEEETAG
jgi:chemotaxis signal transduction protein